jgi:hypothetical protein
MSWEGGSPAAADSGRQVSLVSYWLRRHTVAGAGPASKPGAETTTRSGPTAAYGNEPPKEFTEMLAHHGAAFVHPTLNPSGPALG